MLCQLFNRCERALFIVRIMLGIIFIAHGAQKVLGLFGGPGLEGFAQGTAAMGIPGWLAYCAALAELIGGLLLFFGIASEFGALLIIGVMAGAIWFAHFNKGFFGPEGFEYPLSLLVFAFAILIGGPGDYYLWCPCKKLGCKCAQ